MDAAQLRAMQAPIKERYKSDPSAAVITLKAKGSIDNEGIACKVETGRALAIAGLHPATGGSGMELCSGDMLLEALVACAGDSSGWVSIRCSTASTTTIASSTTIPIASTMASRETEFAEYPMALSTMKVPIRLTGTAMVGMSVARKLPRNR